MAKSAFSPPQKAWNILLFLSAIATILVCMTVILWGIFFSPNSGLDYGGDWVVLAVTPCGQNDAGCQSNQGKLQVGDQLLAIGSLTREEASHTVTYTPFQGYHGGDSVPIEFLRDGQVFTVDWIVPQAPAPNILNLLSSLAIYFPFWVAGMVIYLLLRPHDQRWRILILFNFATTVFLQFGLMENQVPYTGLLMHALTWLILPLYIHLHLSIPSIVLPRGRRLYLSVMYAAGGLLALMELLHWLPLEAFYLGLLLAILGSLSLLGVRLLMKISSSDRMSLRLIFVGFALAFGPGLLLFVLPIIVHTTFSSTTSLLITYAAIPLLPIFYIYAIYKRNLGGLEVRANRLVSLYTFILLYSIGLFLIFAFASTLLHLSGEALLFSLAVSLIFIVVAPQLRSRFQHWFDRIIYGAALNPQEIIRTFALKLPAAFEPEVLIRLITREITPSLLIRESALYLARDGVFSLFYADGITVSNLPVTSEKMEDLLQTAGQYRSIDSTPAGRFDWVRLAVPLVASGKTTGLWLFGRRDPDDFYPQADILLLRTLASQIAPMIENIRLYDETHRRLNRLQSLMDIDIAISSSLDVRFTLDVLLDQVTRRLGVDAADVLLYNPKTSSLEFVAQRGFHSDALMHTRLRLGEGYAGQAALERRMIFIENLDAEGGSLGKSPQLPSENFKSYCAAPLVAKGQVKGVLEVFYRTPKGRDTEWFDFLESFTVQAAIVLDNASLFDDLQRSNTELMLAYDTTLEGWSHALDLRDEGTEGHTQRVTERTERLARVMGITQSVMIHIRRGALLHDMGKMGIPDSILLKPGPLTDEEWKTMRKHPVYAYEMLSPIVYLRPAIDIPYCHHEKWDGSGYPNGLKGEAIPLPARIFSVVDVFDALTSNRPYRGAWTEDQAYEQIRSESGTHFDPEVVRVFLANRRNL